MWFYRPVRSFTVAYDLKNVVLIFKSLLVPVLNNVLQAPCYCRKDTQSYSLYFNALQTGCYSAQLPRSPNGDILTEINFMLAYLQPYLYFINVFSEKKKKKKTGAEDET